MKPNETVNNPYHLKIKKCKICGKDFEVIENMEELQNRFKDNNIDITIDTEFCEACRRKKYLEKTLY
ncbi:hypothetical protein [Methanococcus aeolicus]|uniref:hypothetical protein n=1 Tax=Methanococcus aeolicus TaxID=42879 RepID=UPI0021C96D5B|nr:hypothetical protein [Methanococcus aeolicus]UXM84511.1 hypothetical protein N6C89_07160 [Methanococcus aeolicus]